MEEADKLKRVVEARMKLKSRFEEKMRLTPSVAAQNPKAQPGMGAGIAWKAAKWIHRIAFLTANKSGFREERGYSNTAYPWRNDRYS